MLGSPGEIVNHMNINEGKELCHFKG
jgi:hypothetical protein